MLNYCVQAVGMVVDSLCLSSWVIRQYTAHADIIVGLLLFVRKKDTVFKQLCLSSEQLFNVILRGLDATFSTLPTGPTNTTILNKGVSS
jgi:hypothetical protein